MSRALGLPAKSGRWSSKTLFDRRQELRAPTRGRRERYQGSVTYLAAGGFEITAEFGARTGAALPVTMEQDIGGVAVAGVNAEGVDEPWLGTSWHTAFRIRKALKTTGRFNVAAVGEVTNPASLQRASGPVGKFIGARSVRLGTVVGF